MIPLQNAFLKIRINELKYYVIDAFIIMYAKHLH